MCHDELNLKQVARVLDVHYMTAYRYVRAGRLPARREGAVWLVRSEDLDAYRGLQTTAHDHDHGPSRAPGVVDWPGRLRSHLVAGDEAGAWTVVESSLTSGWSPESVLLDIVGPALHGDETGAGAANAHLAATTAQRVSAVLAARFRRRGRWRGTVVLGAPPGEHHAVAITVLADLLRLRNIAVLELGADVPPAAFVHAATEADRLIAVGISVSTADQLPGAASVATAVRSFDPDVPVLLGGQAVCSPEISAIAGATGWAEDGRGFLALIADLLPAPRPRGPAVSSAGVSQQ